MNRLKLNRWLISLLAIIMLGLVFWPDDYAPSNQENVSSSEFDYFMEDVVIHQFNSNGEPTNKLIAKRMEHSIEQSTSKLSNPKIVYGKSDSGEWQISSEKGELLDGKIVKLINQVNIEDRLINKQTETSITTKNLSIDLEKNIAFTENLVSIKNPHFQTKGTGMEINFDQEIIQLKSNVKTEIYQNKAN